MVDNITGEALIQRSANNEETLKICLETFHKQTAPVANVYKRYCVLTVDHRDFSMYLLDDVNKM